jgi:hypothetical protein
MRREGTYHSLARREGGGRNGTRKKVKEVVLTRAPWGPVGRSPDIRK